MTVFGPDFRAGLVRPLYDAVTVARPTWAVVIFVMLVVVNQVFQLERRVHCIESIQDIVVIVRMVGAEKQ